MGIINKTTGMFVLGVSIAVTAIAALLATLRVVLRPLAVLRVPLQVQRVAQLNAKIVVFRTRLQIEVWGALVCSEMKCWNLAACRVVLLFDCLSHAGCNTGFTRGAVLGGHRYDGHLGEGVGFRMEPAKG